ncbi:MAG: queuosine precursor transporter [Pseudomonadota bacterium]
MNTLGNGSKHLADDRATRLFIVLACFFVTDALLAEFIGVKIFSLERTLGTSDFHWSLLGVSGTLNFTAGVVYWPLVFVLTDIINEYFGLRGVRLVSWVAVCFISWAFIAAYLAIGLAPAPFWIEANAQLGLPDIQRAYAQIFGQGMWTIAGSVTAFLVGQLVDVTIFHRILKLTGEKHMWLRATGSTAVSQLFDSFIVLYIAFVIGPQKWPVSQFLAVGTVNYLYKMLAAVAMIPVLYLVHSLVKRYLGAERTEQLRHEAAR